MKNKKEIIFLTCLLITAFALRLAYMQFLKENYFFYNHPSSDVAFYQQWAREISHQGWIGRTVFYGMPLYTYFLAVLNGITLGNQFFIRIAHLLLGSVNCILLYMLAKKIFSTRVAVISAIIAAANFVLVYYDWLMMPTTLIISLTLAILYGFICLDITSKKRKWFSLGIITGLAVLADGKFLIFGLALSVQLLIQYRSKFLSAIKKIVIPFTSGILIILLCVTLRNYIIAKDFVFISAHGGINFYIGNNPKGEGTFNNPHFLRPFHGGHIDDPKILAEASVGRYLKPSEVSSFWAGKAYSYIKNSPKSYIKLLLKKIVLFFTDAQEAHDMDLIFQENWKKRLDVNPFRLIIPCAILGIIISAFNRRRSASVNLIILSQLIFTLIFFLITRHRTTILPLLIMYQSYALSWLFDTVKSKRRKVAFTCIFAVIILFFILKPTFLRAEVKNFLFLTKSGPIYAERGEHAKAQSYYLQALRLQPFDTSNLYNLANSYLSDKKYNEALYYYQKALKFNPRDTDTRYNMAYTLEEVGDIKSAQQNYQKIIDLQPFSYDARFRIAGIFISQGDCTQALKHLYFILESNPQYGEQITALIDKCSR